MIGAVRKPIDGSFRSWSDGRRVHVVARFTGGNLGRGPVTMHATADLAPAREAVRGYLAEREPDVSGDPVHIEALATRVGAFGLLRKIGRAAKGAALLATAPARALGGAGINAWKTTTNLAKGVQSATALTAYATKPLGWRPGKKGPSAPRPQPRSDTEPESKPDTDEEEAMPDETSGSPRPQTRHVRSAHNLLRRSQSDPKAARHIKNIAKAAAKGHPGAQVAQAAIKEARKSPPPPRLAQAHGWAAFSSWAKGAA